MTDKQRIFSSKEYLKARRPDEFSDSEVFERGRLDRAVLEHHIFTLNTRSQELQFESFAKSLCEKIICSNLLEQTGPVAGGDGKTDTQTFPVSEQNALLWYEGINESSHKEKWAFAVSTNKKWKEKCRTDVRKIKKTNRGYVKAFCITNQYAKADQRSAIEDELTTETDIDVIVLDISWILDQIYKNQYELLAIEQLSIPVLFDREVSVGVNDYSKQKELNELESKIKSEVEPHKVTIEQVYWFLRLAILATELEKPVIETQGLFERAISIANKFGSTQQKLEAYYHYAWKANFWFEDFDLFQENAAKAINCIRDSTSSTQWEKAVTLLNLYSSHTRTFNAVGKMDHVKDLAIEKLTLLAEEIDQPSNSLLAQTHLCFLKYQAPETIADAEQMFADLKLIIEKSENLVGYPFEQTANMIMALDELFLDNEVYEDLLDFITELTIKRDGEITGSMNLLRRGVKRLESGKPYQAIKLVGKSLKGLYKEEATQQVTFALRLISAAYEQAGLLWASRSSMLLAASLLTDQFWKRNELNSKQVQSYVKLVWIELKLGRLGQALQWLELALVIQNCLDEEVLTENDKINIDAAFSHIILNAPLDIIGQLTHFPDSLGKLALDNSRGMLLIALGDEEQFKQEYETDVDKDFLVLVRDYDFGTKLAALSVLVGKRGTVTTSILGCKFSISFPIRSPFLELAESILSILESFLATGHIDNLMPIESSILIDVVVDNDEGDLLISHSFEDEDDFTVLIECSNFEVKTIDRKVQQVVQNWCLKFVFELLSKAFIIKDIESTLEQLFNGDQILDRASSFGSCFAGTYNVLGEDAVSNLKSYFSATELKYYPLTRSKSWDHDMAKSKEEATVQFGNTKDCKFDHEKISHEDMQMQGLIKPRLWDDAKWSGVGFTIYDNGKVGLDLLFKNELAGKRIFQNLVKKVGKHDKENRIKISIITKFSKNNPHFYKVIIGENISIEESHKTLQMISRIQEMTPSNGENLARFKKEYKKESGYILSYGVLEGNKQYKPKDSEDLAIFKFELIEKEAWQIGLNDPERVAINTNDMPIIPDEVFDAPVLDILKNKG
ncbi:MULTISPECIES: hypothetical protein [unclassified Pseudoalteromonas]|uniref:hypothetical protein n=2 Tax=Gammaproteobacteria TaxID=1236 RepID=UPI00332D19FC